MADLIKRREPHGPWEWEIFNPKDGWTYHKMPSWVPERVVLLAAILLQGLTGLRFLDYEKVALVEDE